MKIEKKLNNTHNTTEKRTNNGFRNTKKHSNRLPYVLKLEQHLIQRKNLPGTVALNILINITYSTLLQAFVGQFSSSKFSRWFNGPFKFAPRSKLIAK